MSLTLLQSQREMRTVPPVGALRVGYEDTSLEALLADDNVLAVIGFGSAAPAGGSDSRYLRVALEPLAGAGPFEVWRVDQPVSTGQVGRIRFAQAGGLLFGAIEVDEDQIELNSSDHRATDGVRESPVSAVAGIAASAYAELCAFLDASAHRHPLRIWNYLAAITEGYDDAERYRQFCIGRAQGMPPQWRYPAATAIGIPASASPPAGDRRVLQVYFLAASAAGTPLENPRQLSAYRYPRQYGPQPPTFARGMLGPASTIPLPVMISGTASVRGHASMHDGDIAAQLDETLVNLDAVMDVAREHEPARSESLGTHSVLKVYLRDAHLAAEVKAELRRRLPATALLLLHADICRAELMIEIDGFHGDGTAF
ncbi:MAG: pteridine-dependent deoxygenase [Lysobacteraceae bacterium]